MGCWWGHYTASAIMRGTVVCADPSSTVQELAQAMASEEVGSVVITDSTQVIGIVTERDIVVALANQMDPDTTPAEEIMSPDPLCADIEDSAAVVTERLVVAGVLHAPVMREGRLVGMISSRDLLSRLTSIDL